MESKCLDQFSSGLVLASLTLIASTVRSEFLISVLKDTTQPKSYVDEYINVILYMNVVMYLILSLLSILLIYAIIKKRHKLMIPWLAAASVSILCELLFVVYILARGHSKDVLFLLIGTALTLWIIWTIFCLYKTVRHESRNRTMENINFTSIRNIEIY